MEFDLRCQAAVVEFIDDPANWQQQDDWRHEGRALQRQGGVEPKQILRIHLLTGDVVREAIQHRRMRWAKQA